MYAEKAVHAKKTERREMKKIALLGMMMVAGIAFAANVTDTDDALAFGAGKGVRVTEADTLDDKTFGGMKTVATFTNPISLPALTLVNADGTEWANIRQWHLQLVDGGRTLKFGPARGTQILFR